MVWIAAEIVFDDAKGRGEDRRSFKFFNVSPQSVGLPAVGQASAHLKAGRNSGKKDERGLVPILFREKNTSLVAFQVSFAVLLQSSSLKYF